MFILVVRGFTLSSVYHRHELPYVCMTLEMYRSTLAFTSVNIILYNVTQLTAIHHNFHTLLYLKYKINNRSSLKFKFKNCREVKAGIHREIHVAKKEES